MNARFVTETIEREDGTSFQREVLLTDAGNGEMAARVATDADRVAYGDAYARFKNPASELRRQMAELEARHADLSAQHEEMMRPHEERDLTPTQDEQSLPTEEHSENHANG